MHKPQQLWILAGGSILAFSGLLIGQTGGTAASAAESELTVSHPECTFFGPQRERFVREALKARGSRNADTFALSASTERVSQMLGAAPGGSRTYSFDQAHQAGSIDSYIFADWKANAITPAPKTTDWEFIRRVTLDLTGRIPAPDRVLTFIADTAPNKRAILVDELLAKPEWVDKWTMFFGDLSSNTSRNTFVVRYEPARNAFYQWI